MHEQVTTCVQPYLREADVTTMKMAESAAHTAYDGLRTAQKELDSFSKASNAKLKKSGRPRE